MGKKEKEIKRQTDQFYKEYNYIRDDKKECMEEDENQKLIDKEENSMLHFDNLLLNIKHKLLDYVDHRGLPICEKLDDTNIANYVLHLINGCPTSISNTMVEEPIVECGVVKKMKDNENLLDLDEIDKLQAEIDSGINSMVTKLGEFDIFQEYIKHAYPDNPSKILEERILLPLLRRRMIKISGSVDKYNEWVNRIGLYEYKKIEKIFS